MGLRGPLGSPKGAEPMRDTCLFGVGDRPRPVMEGGVATGSLQAAVPTAAVRTRSPHGQAVQRRGCSKQVRSH